MYISRLRPNSGSKFASQLHKSDNTRMDLHAATCCDGNLRPSHRDQKCEWHRYDSAGRLLPSQDHSLSRCTGTGVDVIQASQSSVRSTPTSELPDPRANRQGDMATRVPQRTRQPPSFELRPCDWGFRSYIYSRSRGQVIMVQSCDEMRQVPRGCEVKARKAALARQQVHRLLPATSVQNCFPSFS